MLSLTKDQENFISMVKKKIKAECKFILNMAGTKNALLKDVLEEILEKGCVSGSILSNVYHDGKHSNLSDLDIFLNYSENDFERYKKVFNSNIKDVEILSWDDESYRTKSVQSVKFTIGGAMSSVKVNILFVENLQDFRVLVQNFDFETSNWFYEYKDDSLFITEECYMCLSKHELNYTELYKVALDDKILKYNAAKEINNAFNVQHELKNEIFGSEIKRLQNYVNVKKYVLSENMKKIIENINSKCVEIWKI